jgi:hypothetical protein
MDPSELYLHHKELAEAVDAAKHTVVSEADPGIQQLRAGTSQTEWEIELAEGTPDVRDVADELMPPLLIGKMSILRYRDAMRGISTTGAETRYQIGVRVAEQALRENFDAWYDDALAEDTRRSDKA